MKTFHPDGRAAKERRPWALLAFVVLFFAGTTLLSKPSAAQEDPDGEELEGRQTSSMREWVYKELGQAQEKTEADQFEEAIRELDKLIRKDLNSYERSQAWNLYAYIYYSQERYPEAIEAYRKLLDEEDVFEALKTTTIYSLAQLYFVTENWQKAIAALGQWFETNPKARPQHYAMLAQAHYQLQEYRKAIAPLKKAISLRQEAGEPVSENTYLLLRVLYFELDDLDAVIGVLEELIESFPGETYWMQLAGVYGQKGDDKKRLNILELAYLQGFLDSESELMALAGLMLNSDLPYRAGEVLEKGLAEGVVESTQKNWRLLSQAWLMAREDQKAIPALTRAADLSKNGELDILLAQSYMNLEDWERAADAARKGIAKGSLPRQDQAYFMLGQVLFRMNAFDESRGAFEEASRDERSRRLASQWLRYVDSEEDRRAQLKAALEEG